MDDENGIDTMEFYSAETAPTHIKTTVLVHPSETGKFTDTK